VRILVLTDRSPELVLPAASTVGADLKTEPLSPDALARLADLSPQAVLADADPDPARAFDVLTVLAAAGSPVGAIVVLSRPHLEAFDWYRVADDVISPDASEAEVRLRLALLRSRRGETGEDVLRLGAVAINVATYQITVGGRPLDLTYKEFELLRFLAEHQGRVFTRAKLLQEVWGYDFYGGTRTVDVHVRRLRAKLGPEHEHLIETVRGVGYRAASGGMIP